MIGPCVFEWTLDRRFLVQRARMHGDGPPARWERGDDARSMQLDFELTYRRVGI